MNFKEKLKLIKQILLTETYNINLLYFGNLVQVYNKEIKDIYYLGGHDWFWTDSVTYKPLKWLLLEEIENNKYKDLETQKIYTTTEFVERDYNMKKGELYIYSKSLIPYTEIFEKEYPYNIVKNEDALNNLKILRKSLKKKESK